MCYTKTENVIMNLYPHNQQAYNNAVEALKASNRTCVIHATGTGKSVIIAEFISKNPGKNHLLLAPSGFISEEIQKYTSDEFDFSTYQGLGFTQTNIKYDFIYLDEFHRIGADQWGRNTLSLLDDNKDAKIIGTSATPIRYLDDQRNMATEIFDDNIASSLSLIKAISTGILKAPTYVSALYSISTEYEKMIKKIRDSNHKDKELLAEKLKSNVIDWERTGGIDAILKKHLNVSRNRIIVFCKNRAHMEQAKSILMPTLKFIWEKVEAIEVYSEFSKNTNSKALKDFSDKSYSAKVLFTIDMLNEGLHVKGANTVILLRDTVSPIVFYQQIGRCFSVNQSEAPLIFDLVNNFSGIRINEFESDFKKEINAQQPTEGKDGIGESKSFSITFFDETRDIQEVFGGIEHDIDDWEVMFHNCADYFKEHGNLDIATDHKLYNWVRVQRWNYSTKTLSKHREENLNSIGMNWFPYDKKFEDWLAKIKNFIVENGRTPSPKEDKSLYDWINTRRKEYKKGILRKDKQRRLSDVFSLDPIREIKSWEEIFALIILKNMGI